MKFNLISREVSDAYGYGPTWGETITEKYECPCGKGFILTEHDTHTGHKQFFASLNCKECEKRYEIINASSRSWSLVSRNTD